MRETKFTDSVALKQRDEGVLKQKDPDTLKYFVDLNVQRGVEESLQKEKAG